MLHKHAVYFVGQWSAKAGDAEKEPLVVGETLRKANGVGLSTHYPLERTKKNNEHQQTTSKKDELVVKKNKEVTKEKCTLTSRMYPNGPV